MTRTSIRTQARHGQQLALRASQPGTGVQRRSTGADPCVRVRVWEMTLEPGETCDLHRHRHDYLMIYPDAALGRSSSRSRLERVEAGLVAFATVGAEGLPPHQITNAGGCRSMHYVIELLGPSAAATAQPVAHNGRVQVEHRPAGA